jgi:hypothetical protein
VAEAGLEDLAAGDEERGDVVTEPVQRRSGDAGCVAESGEAVPERSPW